MNDDVLRKALAIAALFFVSCLVCATLYGWQAIVAGVLGSIGIAVALRFLRG
jgi:hypothetical protein